MAIQFEHTDTFGGESNYSWVKRHKFTPAAELSDLALVRRAKKWAGLTGEPCRVDRFGDMLAIWPRHICQVVFVTFPED